MFQSGTRRSPVIGSARIVVGIPTTSLTRTWRAHGRPDWWTKFAPNWKPRGASYTAWILNITGRSPTRRPSVLMKSFGFWPNPLAALVWLSLTPRRLEPRRPVDFETTSDATACQWWDIRLVRVRVPPL